MRISEAIEQSIAVKRQLVTDSEILATIGKISEVCIDSFKNGGKVLFCGNGGSAADAQHLAAELSGRFYFDRPPLDSEALHVNTSYLTAVANDYSFEEIFSRLVRAKGKSGDILIGLSTSGNSVNVIRAFEAANELGMITVALTGETGGKLKSISQYLIRVPSKDTPRIQESHILLGHIICELIESKMFGLKR
ncbi:MAG: D-sedoheptulose 7-phosphate isomerase [Bacteroidetes bacterium]|nr:D-sedoheptulose 7-phosphate isomerase [Bacteroidota bacterium]